MSTQNYLEEKLASNAYVYINGQEVKFVSLILNQSIGQHHTFSIEMDYDSMKQYFLNNPLEHMKLSDRFVEVDLQQSKDSANTYEFGGVISNVSNKCEEVMQGQLIIERHNTAILSERGKRMDVFSHMDLSHVLDEVTYGIINKELSNGIAAIRRKQLAVPAMAICHIRRNIILYRSRYGVRKLHRLETYRDHLQQRSKFSFRLQTAA